MKKTFMLSSIIVAFAIIAVWGSLSSNAKGAADSRHQDASHSPKQETPSREEKKDPLELTQEVFTDHLKIRVSNHWMVTTGLDSISFFQNKKPLGLIEGLGYSDSVDSLVPNHSIIKKNVELQNLPFKAYEVVTQSDALKSKTKTETHIYIFVEPKKEVYDLHFDSGAVDEPTILKIVQSVVIF